MDKLSASGLSIAHLNVGSLLAINKFEMFKTQIKSSNIDIFGISESWLSDAVPTELIDITGFNVARLDRTWSDIETSTTCKKGGGLLCYINSSIQFSDTKYSHLNCSCKDLELQWVTVSGVNLRQIVILNVYRPPQGNYTKACKLINDSITQAGLKENAEVFLMGDFNIDLKLKESPLTKELMFTTGLNGLLPKIHETTRRSNKAGKITETCIDNIFTNSSIIAESRVLNLNISDHLAVFVRRKKPRITTKKVNFVGRSYKNFIREDFQESLINKDWTEFYNSSDPEECWGLLENTIRSELDLTCPLKNFRLKEIREAWITNELLEEINDKDSYLKIARASGAEDDWQTARRERNRVGKMVRNAKAEFVKEQQREFKNDPKKFWKAISTIMPKKKQSSNNISLMDQYTGADVPNTEVADYINNFFSNIGPDLASKLTEPWSFQGTPSEEECQELSTDYEEVLKLCKEISISKSSGISDIAAKIFKSAFLVLIPQLVYLFNLSFSTGNFPNRWKQATVIPLFKGGDRKLVGNYRPISLLPLPGKLIEKIAHNKLSSFLEEQGVLSDRQNGFRKGFSTASAVSDLTDDIFSATNESETTLAFFVDLRKAFDTVSHDILCKKISNYGLRGKVLGWCSNYLANREQQTLVNNVKSAKCHLSFGVPQGSVLGPLFFILYVNDIQSALQGIKVQMYADDTVIFESGSNLNVLVDHLQSNLCKFQKWCNSNKLTLNPSKTKLVTFGIRQSVKKAKTCELYLGGKRIQNVPTFRYLGFVLDSTLNFKAHISDVIKKVIHKKYLLSRLMPFLNKNVALLIYKTMVLPYFDYCDVVYATACTNDLEKLQRVQNKCLKTCLSLHNLHGTDDVHRQASSARLGPRRKAHLCNFMFTRQKRNDLLDTREIGTRQHDAPSFTVPFPHLESFKRSVKYNGAVTWNDLPKKLKQMDSLNVFKFTQKRLMFATV